MTKISTVIPAFNAENFVAKAVESALEQGVAGHELIVVDDGSSDATASFAARYGDPVRVVSQPNRGLSAARNRGILEAQGAYVGFLDADDYWLPGKLQAQLALFDADPELGFVSCEARLEDESGNVRGEWRLELGEGDLLEGLFKHNGVVPASGSGVVVRRDLFAVVGLFDTALSSLEDVDMWMRLASASRFACVTKIMAVILKHENSMSSNHDRMLANARVVMEKNRCLLTAPAQRSVWRSGYGGMLTDYAKWAYRRGQSKTAIRLLMEAATTSTSTWKTVAGIGLDMLRSRSL